MVREIENPQEFTENTIDRERSAEFVRSLSAPIIEAFGNSVTGYILIDEVMRVWKEREYFNPDFLDQTHQAIVLRYQKTDDYLCGIHLDFAYPDIGQITVPLMKSAAGNELVGIVQAERDKRFKSVAQEEQDEIDLVHEAFMDGEYPQDPIEIDFDGSTSYIADSKFSAMIGTNVLELLHRVPDGNKGVTRWLLFTGRLSPSAGECDTDDSVIIVGTGRRASKWGKTSQVVKAYSTAVHERQHQREPHLLGLVGELDSFAAEARCLDRVADYSKRLRNPLARTTLEDAAHTEAYESLKRGDAIIEKALMDGWNIGSCLTANHNITLNPEMLS